MGKLYEIQISLSTSFYWNTVTVIHMYYLSMATFLWYDWAESLQQRPENLQSVKYLLSGPLPMKLARLIFRYSQWLMMLLKDFVKLPE